MGRRPIVWVLVAAAVCGHLSGPNAVALADAAPIESPPHETRGFLRGDSRGIGDAALPVQCDVVIAGGSTSALAAALSAARQPTSPQLPGQQRVTCLLEPTDWAGGQLTASGVSAIDFGPALHDPANLPRDFASMLRALGPNPGRCTVGSMDKHNDPAQAVNASYCYAPRRLLEAWIKPALENATDQGLRVFYNTVVMTVATSATGNTSQLLSLTAVQRTARKGTTPWSRTLSEEITDWYNPTDSAAYEKQLLNFSSPRGAPVFIDATETGDVLVVSDAEWRQGVEVPTEAGPATHDTCGTAITYPFYARLLASPPPTPEPPVPTLSRNYGIGGFAKPYCDAGSWSPADQWGCVWAWRRAVGTGGPVNAARSGELSAQNWNGNYTFPNGTLNGQEGNDYPRAYWLLPAAEARATAIAGNWTGGVNITALHQAELQAYGYYEWFKNAAPASSGATPERIVLARAGADPDGGAGTEHGLSKWPYIRDTRRSVGLDGYMLQAADVTRGRPTDVVALVDYGLDVHRMDCQYPSYVTERHGGGAGYVPLRSLTNAAHSNLLVSGKTIAASFLAMAQCRLQPGEWATGLAAGVAASMMADLGLSSADLAANHLDELQTAIERDAPLSYAHATAASVGHSGAATAPIEDIDILAQRLTGYFLEFGDCTQAGTGEGRFCAGGGCAAECANATHYADALDMSNGTWPDVNYSDYTNAQWQQAAHLRRTLAMARALSCASSGCSHVKGNSTLLARTHAALGYWLRVNPRNPNWWWVDIGVPQYVETILHLLQSSLTARETEQGLAIMGAAHLDGMSGQNFIWEAQVLINIASITRNSSAAADAFQAMWGAVKLATDGGDGIQPDMSFRQHGALLQNGAYGEDEGLNLVTFAALSSGLKAYEPPEAVISLLADYMLDGQGKMLRWNGQSDNNSAVYFDVAPKGREIVRQPYGSVLYPTYVVAPSLRSLPRTHRTPELLALADRLAGNGTHAAAVSRVYWQQDYVVHSRQDWFTSLHMSSTRTYGAECVNGEGLQSWHLAEGFTGVYQTGEEVVGSFPVWDWLKLSGVTARQGVSETGCEVKKLGRAAFVGGATNGNFSVAAMDFISGDWGGAYEDSAPITARKMWAFTGFGFVALTANLTLAAPQNVSTALAQRRLENVSPLAANGDGVTTDATDSPLPSGTHAFNNVSWLHHDATLYLIGNFAGLQNTGPASLVVRNELASGAWSQIASDGPTAPVSEEMLLTYVDHGVSPAGASLAYAVAPAVAAGDAAAAAAQIRATTTIVSNCAAVQALLSAGQHPTLFVAAYVAGVGVAGPRSWTLSGISVPCLLLVSESDGRVVFSASDPSRASLSVSFVIDRSIAALVAGGPGSSPFETDTVQCVQSGGNTRVTITLAATGATTSGTC